MQKFYFLGHNQGKAKNSGKPYDIANVSTGLEAFPPFNVANEKVGKFLDTLEHGQEFYADVDLSVAFGAIRATITNASLSKK